jgi:hypothetical protein
MCLSMVLLYLKSKALVFVQLSGADFWPDPDPVLHNFSNTFFQQDIFSAKMTCKLYLRTRSSYTGTVHEYS